MSLDYVHLDSNLKEQQFHRMLDIFIERIINKMNLNNEDERKDLLKNKDKIVEGLKEDLKEKEFQLQYLNNPRFIQKFTFYLVTTILGKEDKPKHGLEKLVDGLEKLKQRLKGEKPKKDDLKDKLDPEELKELQKAFKHCKEEFKKLLKPSPDKTKKPEKEAASKTSTKAPEDVVNANLFGLVNVYMTGGLPAVVTCFIGNYSGIVDVNPEHGSAGIDLVNKIDFSLTDPLGLETLAAINFEQFEDMEEIDPGLALYTLQSEESTKDFVDDLQQSLRPSLTMHIPGIR